MATEIERFRDHCRDMQADRGKVADHTCRCGYPWPRVDRPRRAFVASWFDVGCA